MPISFSRFLRRLFCAAVLCISAGASADAGDLPPADGLIYLENAGVRVGILPSAGGRVVFFAPSGEENYLLSNPSLWNKAPNTETFIGFDGHIYWLGPQDGWGRRLDVDGPEKPARWPPDLHLTASLYTVEAQTDSSIRLRSPDSPRSGVRLLKTVEISEAGEVRLTVTMENCVNTPVQWGIWSNTRVAADAEVFVATEPGAPFHVGELPKEQEATPPFAFVGGCVTWLNSEPLEAGLKRVVGKLFLHRPSAGAVAILVPGRKKMWVKQHSLHTEVAPGQAPIELYLSQLADGTGVQEVEAHGSYTKLGPGDSTSWEETWTLLERPAVGTLIERAVSVREVLGRFSMAP